MIKKILNYLDGKKTKIAAFYNAVTWPAIMILTDNAPNGMMVKANMIIGLVFMFIGVGHGEYKRIKNKSKNQ